MAAVDVEQEEDDSTVAAISGKQQKSQWKKNKFQKGDRQQQKHSRGQQQQQEKNMPMDLVIAASGLCRAHWFNGEKAKGCSQGMGCSWQGN